MIEPAAAAPLLAVAGARIDGYVALLPFDAGLFAVPVNVAVSLIALPISAAAVAFVVMVGVTGMTSKHSPADASAASGTPSVGDSKKPRQQ